MTLLPRDPAGPRRSSRGINACIGLSDALHKLTEQALARYAMADVQALLDELDAAAAQLERARRCFCSQPIANIKRHN